MKEFYTKIREFVEMELNEKIKINPVEEINLDLSLTHDLVRTYGKYSIQHNIKYKI